MCELKPNYILISETKDGNDNRSSSFIIASRVSYSRLIKGHAGVTPNKEYYLEIYNFVMKESHPFIWVEHRRDDSIPQYIFNSHFHNFRTESLVHFLWHIWTFHKPILGLSISRKFSFRKMWFINSRVNYESINQITLNYF